MKQVPTLDIPYLIPVEIEPESSRYPAAILTTDDFDAEITILFSGPGAMPFAEEIARRCNKRD